jgi:hypothetical protein
MDGKKSQPRPRFQILNEALKEHQDTSLRVQEAEERRKTQKNPMSSSAYEALLDEREIRATKAVIDAQRAIQDVAWFSEKR